MSYVDGYWEKERNQILMVERVNGERVYRTYPARYVVMFPSPRGKYQSIHREPLDKFETNRWEEFQKELRMIPPEKRYESDINPVFRCIYDNYRNAPSPRLNVAFWDIEVGWDAKRGFSSVEEAFNSLHRSNAFGYLVIL